jgi:hypothetical protein
MNSNGADPDLVGEVDRIQNPGKESSSKNFTMVIKTGKLEASPKLNFHRSLLIRKKKNLIRILAGCKFVNFLVIKNPALDPDLVSIYKNLQNRYKHVSVFWE